MTSNKIAIKLNKTEYLLFNPNNVNFPVGSSTISPGDYTKNFGVIFYTDTSMDKHNSSIIKSYFYQLRDFRRIRPFIFKIKAIILANDFVHSRLDFCYSIFYDLPKYYIHRLQKIKNIVARFVTNSFCFSSLNSIF